MNTKPSNNNRALIDAVVEILNQGEALLTEINDDAYTRKLPAAFNASIGGHYRHCLDHFQNLFDAAAKGDLNYDRRERNTLVENDRSVALHATRAARENYRRLAAHGLDRPFKVTCKTNYAVDGSQTSASTISREIMYVVSHAVHHYALIGIVGAMMNLKMPAGFGVAPSTLKYRGDLVKASRVKPAPSESVHAA